MTEKNALAELAAELKRSLNLQMPWTSYYRDRVISCTPEVIDKSMRIIAELAKVVDCNDPERIMPFDEPYDDIILYAPYDNGVTESNSINEDEKRFIFDLANAAWNCRAIAEE